MEDVNDNDDRGRVELFCVAVTAGACTVTGLQGFFQRVLHFDCLRISSKTRA